MTVMTPTGLHWSPQEARHLLRVILERLCWTGSEAAIHEALPHFVDHVTPADLRNALLALGFTTRRVDKPLDQAHPQFGLVLAQSATGRTIVPVDVSENNPFRIVTQYGSRPIGDAERKHYTAFYTIGRLSADGNVDSPQNKGKSGGWFQDMVRRFGDHWRVLLIVSFVINCLAIAGPVMIMVIYDRVIGQQSGVALPMLALALVALVAVELVVRLIKAKTLAWLAARMDHLIGTAAFTKLFKLPLVRMDNAPVSAQLQRLKEFEGLRDFFSGPLASATVELPFVIISFLALWIIAGPLALIPTVGALLLVLTSWLIGRWRHQLDRGQAKSENARQAFFLESANNAQVVVQAGVSDLWQQRFRELSARATTEGAKQRRAAGTLEAMTSLVMNICVTTTIVLGTLMVIAGDLTTGGLIAAMALVWRLLSPFQTLVTAAGKLVQTVETLNHVDRFFGLHNDVKLSGRLPAALNTPMAIRFERVVFKYQAAPEPILRGLSFDIRPGEIFGITGPSSSGKTSVIRLILRLYEAQSGHVRVDEHDVRQIDAYELRKLIGYAPQQSDLFYGTIRQNILLGAPPIDEEQFRNVVDAVGLSHTVSQLPHGFETRIGDTHSKTITRGLRRGIILARALVRNPRLLILDEPEQGLDSTSTAYLSRFIAEERGKRTVLIISHRPSLLRLADRVLHMDHGRAVALAPPETILGNLLTSGEAA